MFRFSILLLVSGGYSCTYHVCKVQSRCPRSADAAHGLESWEWQPLASCPIFLLCYDGFAPCMHQNFTFTFGVSGIHTSVCNRAKLPDCLSEVWTMVHGRKEATGGNLHGYEWHLESFSEGFTLGSYHWFLLGWWQCDGYAIMSIWPMPAYGGTIFYAGIDTKMWLHQRVLNRLGWPVERWTLGCLVPFVLDSVHKFITATPCPHSFWARISWVNTAMGTTYVHNSLDS